MNRYFALVFSFTLALALPTFAQDSGDKHIDIRSSAGDLHIGSDADAKKVGLPLYPGARLKSDEDSKNKANLSLLTDAFGLKMLIASYDSDDAPARVIDFYRDKLKKYGKVLECHSDKHGGDLQVHASDKDSKENKELKCDENSGPVVELKVGTEEDQHMVAVEPQEKGKGATFALVYIHTRGKRGEI